ncbi:hypothetical protein D3C71_1791800 [compost metagenome]
MAIRRYQSFGAIQQGVVSQSFRIAGVGTGQIATGDGRFKMRWIADDQIVTMGMQLGKMMNILAVHLDLLRPR